MKCNVDINHFNCCGNENADESDINCHSKPDLFQPFAKFIGNIAENHFMHYGIVRNLLRKKQRYSPANIFSPGVWQKGSRNQIMPRISTF